MKTAIHPKRSENFAEWYQKIIVAADLADNSPTRGCMVIKPAGYAIWENIQKILDKEFKRTGHTNAYFPLLIPLSFLEKEAEHINGFAKECAIVTHHKLKQGENGLELDGKLEEPLIIRPTSETIIGYMYAKWIKSYKDLPILINQWANIVRWEMRPRMFLRTAEILWQEGHTAHESSKEAIEETLNMLEIYKNFAEDILAIPMITGRKPCFEKFPGAIETYTLEAMMQDKKALQAGTSHFLGQNFAKAFNIKYSNRNNEEEHVWTTSWGMTTRLIGALIMVHSDDDGFIAPPKIAEFHIVILPIHKNKNSSEIMQYCNNLYNMLIKQQFFNNEMRVFIDNKNINGGEKKWNWIKKGAPIIVEIGQQELENNSISYIVRYEHNMKHNINLDEFADKTPIILENLQNNLYAKALKFRDENIKNINNLAELKNYFKNNEGGFAKAYAIDDPQIEATLKILKITARCIIDSEPGKCIFSDSETNCKMIFARAY